MLKNQLTPVRIDARDVPLSKAQKTFNNQIQKIEKLRARLAKWDAAQSDFQRKYANDMMPLLRTMRELQVKLVHALDLALAQKGLTPAERRALKELLCDLAGQLLDENDDAELKSIYNRHSKTDYDSEEAAGLQEMKMIFENLFDMDLGDEEGLDSREEFLRRAQTQFEDEREQFEADMQAQQEKRAKRKKTAKQLEKEARAEADAQQVNQSLRTIYRKLASALHPDRETDPQERERKTALMQRINQAYDKQNLLQLLELQLELEHIDRSSMSGLNEERLRHYNVILKKQIVELEQEAMHIEAEFCMRFGMPPIANLKPENLLRELVGEIVQIQQINKELEQDLQAIDTPKTLKAWVKQLRRQPRGGHFDDFLF